jgi:YVTN family beta-propeller protein
MKNYYKKSIAIIAGLLCTASSISQDFSEGVLVLNEGLFGSETASVSHFDETGTLQNDIFRTQNGGVDLGNTAQGMGFSDDFAYIVLNGTAAVKVIDRVSFELVATITDQMVNPRNIAVFNGKGYVTNWGDGAVADDDYVAVIDLATNTVIETIPVTEGPEEIIQQGGILFIAHQGGFGYGNTVSVIDTATNVVESIPVGDVPSALRIDESNLYVLCSGNPDFSGNETAGSLIKIDLTDFQNREEFAFPELEHPKFLGVDNTDVYYLLNADIYKMALTATALPTTPFIDTASQNLMVPYSFNKIDDQLYIGDAIDFVSDGKVFVYGEDGTFVSEYTVGSLPNGFYNYEEEALNTPNFDTLSISLYPNPASENFRLNTSENIKIMMFDISGRLVKEMLYTSQAISVEGLKAGIYLVQLENKGTFSTQKLIVE